MRLLWLRCGRPSLLRPLLHACLRWAPPVALACWIAYALVDFYGAAVPAFGSIEAHLKARELRALGHLGVGALLAAVWAVAWARIPGRPRLFGRSGRGRSGANRGRRTLAG